jgi:predicted permease
MQLLRRTDLEAAARGLFRAPAVALSAVVCLALGIGATTAIASALSRALLDRPPFREPERLVAAHRVTPQSGPQGTWPMSPASYLDLAARSKRISQLAAMAQGTALITMPNDAIRATQRAVTGNFFPMLGLAAARGRMLTESDDRLDAPLVAVVSHEFWTARLGADTSLVGRTLTIDGEPTTIVGITPPDFRVPFGLGGVVRADLWTPMRFSVQARATRNSNYLQMVGRLADGASLAAADADLKAAFASIVAEHPELKGESVRVAGLVAEGTGAVRTPLLLLFGAVAMVLMIAATNVAALLLARGVARRRELAVRTALGASPWDAMRVPFSESLLLAGAGGVLGIGLALAGIRTIGALAAARVPQLAGLTLDVNVIAFAVVTTLSVTLAAGIVPAWRAGKVDPQDAMRSGRGGGASREHQRTLRALVVAEIGLSLVLLIGAGLVLKAFSSLLAKDPGFDVAHVLTMNVTLAPTRYAQVPSAHGFLEPAIDAIQAVPGVEGAGSINVPPYINWGSNSNVRYEGREIMDPTRYPIVEMRSVSPGFFDVTKQRLLSGRLLAATDNEQPGSPAVVVVNQALVDRDFKGQNPVGRRYYLNPGTPGDTSMATIVGVVSNIRNMGPVADPAPEMYWTAFQNGLRFSNYWLMIRTAGDPTAAVPAIREAIRRVDPTAAIGSVRAMPEVINQSLGRPQFYLAMLGTFAVVAIVLAGAGLYGVLSYAVAQRTRELGIRIALGSPQARVVTLVTRQGVQLVAAGTVMGIAGGLAATRLLTFILYGVSPLDVTTWAAAIVAMGLCGLAACAVPALRATRVNPLEAIQAE